MLDYKHRLRSPAQAVLAALSRTLAYVVNVLLQNNSPKTKLTLVTSTPATLLRCLHVLGHRACSGELGRGIKDTQL